MVDRATGSRGAVVVTGASSGIGEACALHLARAGFRVFGGVRRTEDGERLEAASEGRVTALPLDVTEAASIAAASQRVAEEIGGLRLAGIVNNAGIVVAGPLEFVPVEDLRRQLEVNTIAPVAVTQAFLPLLRRSRGRVVHIGSSSGLISTPFVGPYAASKFAMEAIADAMRMELAPWGIHVSIVDPGAIATPIWTKSRAAADAMLARMPAEMHELYGSAIPKVLAATERSERAGIPPVAVARAVARALTARRPKPRYMIGRDAQVQVVIGRLLPARVRDRLILRELGL